MHGQAPELLVNHVVVVIAKPQFHSCESWPVLHTEEGRESQERILLLDKRVGREDLSAERIGMQRRSECRGLASLDAFGL